MPQSNTDERTELLNLDVTRVALCNQGANTRAYIMLTKRKENSQMPKFANYEELIAALEPEVVELIKSHENTAIAAKDTELTAAKEQLVAKEAELKKALETSKPIEPSTKDDDVLKSLPAELRDRFEKQQQLINELVQNAQNADANRRYDLVKSIPCEEATLKAVLKTISPEVFEVLKAAAAAIDKNTLKEGTGSDASGVMKSGNTAQQAYDELDKLAKSLAKDGAMTYEAAFTKACIDNAELYNQYTKGV